MTEKKTSAVTPGVNMPFEFAIGAANYRKQMSSNLLYVMQNVWIFTII